MLGTLLWLWLTCPAIAGSWQWQIVGPGSTPGSTQLRVDVSSTSGDACSGYCAWSNGDHRLQISPAPLAVLNMWPVTPIENGAEL